MTEKERLLQIRSKARDYRELSGIPEFAKFKQQEIDTRLEMLRQSIFGADLSTEEGKRLLINNVALYQQLNQIFNDVFSNWELADQKAKELLAKRIKQ